jgi:hypothetical protein
MTEIENLVESVKQATDYQKNKRILKEKITADLHFPYNNGLFKITPELLSFLATWPTDDLYLEDTYENPIRIDRQVFLVTAQQHYAKVMDHWYTKHEELKRIRRI